MRSITFLVLLALMISCSQKKSESASDHSLVETRMAKWLKDGEYFRIGSELERSAHVLPKAKLKFYQAFVEGAFNHRAIAISLADSLLKGTDPMLTDSARVELLLLLRDNYFKSFQYREAAATGRTIVTNYKSILGDRLHDIENDLIIHDGLKDVAAQVVTVKEVNLKWKPNKLGLIEIPIKTRGETLAIIFDTRAHLSTVTESFARKLHLRILDTSFEESSGITGIKFQARLGVADTLFLGDVMIQNAIFQVLPDEQLHFPSLNFTLDGILGFPVITQLKEVHIFQNGDFVISPTTEPGKFKNLAFDRSTTAMSVVNDADTLTFHFDTGATGTEFYGNYFNQFKEKTMSNGKLEIVESGGVGGTIKTEVYILPVVNLRIGETKIELKDIAVRTKPSFKGQKYNGNIGQDVIKQFDEMVLNFEDMYVSFR